MKLETFRSPTTEIFLEFDGGNVTSNPWSNGEGASVILHGKGPGFPLRMAAALSWEEIDALIMALTAARAA